MAFTRRTEVRHITPAQLIKIAEILNQTPTNPAWKRLMQTVPYELTHPEDLSFNECKFKYTHNHIRSVENAAAKLNKNAAQIFLEEWITSGKIRPSIGHLLQLLVKSEIFRAADYVAVNILSEAPPQRPSKGPAAKIDITLSSDIDEEMLNGNYPNYPNSSEIINLNKGHIPSKHIPNKDIPMSEVDLIHFSAPVQEIQQNNNAPSQTVATTSGLATRQENISIQNSVPVSEYSDSDSIVLPNISHIGHSATHPLPNQTNVTTQVVTATSSDTMSESNISHQQVQSSQIDFPSELSHNGLPNFSMLNNQFAHSNNLNSHDVDELVPNFAQLNLCQVSGTQNSTNEGEFSEYIPQFSAFYNQSQSSSDNVVPRT